MVLQQTRAPHSNLKNFQLPQSQVILLHTKLSYKQLKVRAAESHHRLQTPLSGLRPSFVWVKEPMKFQTCHRSRTVMKTVRGKSIETKVKQFGVDAYYNPIPGPQRTVPRIIGPTSPHANRPRHQTPAATRWAASAPGSGPNRSQRNDRPSTHRLPATSSIASASRSGLSRSQQLKQILASDLPPDPEKRKPSGRNQGTVGEGRKNGKHKKFRDYLHPGSSVRFKSLFYYDDRLKNQLVQSALKQLDWTMQRVTRALIYISLREAIYHLV